MENILAIDLAKSRKVIGREEIWSKTLVLFIVLLKNRKRKSNLRQVHQQIKIINEKKNLNSKLNKSTSLFFNSISRKIFYK